jgi:imidazolonepropionase-like amidohydrolase
VKTVVRVLLVALLLVAACGTREPPEQTLIVPTLTSPAPTPTTGEIKTDESSPSLVLLGTLIDGTGTGPLPDAALVIQGDRIVAVGPRAEISIPHGAQIIELPQVTILPGFINMHVHYSHSKFNRRTWAQGGVTTVREVGARVNETDVFVKRDQLNAVPEYARALTAGPILSLETATAIVDTAHARGIPVTVHVTRLRDLIKALDAGVDNIAHMIREPAPDAVIQRMVEAGVTWVPTLEPFEGRDSGNLRRFIDAGGVVAMGNDSGLLVGIVVGMPMPEIEYMQAAGMTPLEIIVASTRNAAYVCDRLSTLGTLEVGKYADVLVVEGDPLQDLQVLKNVRLVVHSGVIIRQEE